jgi:F-type H+-transporting ATPase subunit delta
MKNSQLTGLLTSLAGRYAKTLYELASDQGKTPEITTQFQSFISFLDNNEDFEHILLSPVLTHDEHIGVFDELCSRLKIDLLLKQFFHLLCDNGRLDHLRGSQIIFQQIYDEQENKHKTEVISARPLTPSQQEKISELLKTQITGSLSLNFLTNPHLLGGFLVRNKNRVVDLTVANRLTKLINTMKGKA